MGKKYVLLVSIILQVCVGQQEKFSFPAKIQALLDSCVEIPCTIKVSSTGAQNKNKVVWHVIAAELRQRIIYSTDMSQISTNYRNRANLVRDTPDNCTLRIHRVERQDARNYYPQEEKRNAFRPASQYVQLEVTDHPPEPVLSVPSEMIADETTTILCMVNYTCASSPPTFTWNLIGPSTTESSDLGDGKWTATSKLNYKPSEAENGSTIQCTVTYFGGQTIQTRNKINIKAHQNTSSYIGPVVGVICVIFLLAIPFIIWRKRDSSFCRKGTEYNKTLDPTQNALSKNSNRYEDLLERQKSFYYTIERAANDHVPKQGPNMMQPPENAAVYEEMSTKQTK
ncbi:B-cell receptor CD22-like isoform X2 [Eleutherodactylus coqui]|uniref:B-cell receptor CD22-like isoform X2 n=1 Tax=Eleutherodactylus coqui TaxID=57060 RepID=UPI003462662A